MLRDPAEDGAGRLDVGAGTEERVEDLDVVAAGGPMQRGHRVGAGEAGVDLGARRDQHADNRGAIGMVAGPVDGDVQQRGRYVLDGVRISVDG